MGAIGGMLGVAGGASGTGFSNPERANLATGATEAQANQLYGQNQDALTKQKQFLDQILAQNGLQNQSNVFNTLGQIANGQGPNPAAAMLNQATGANVSNTAAAMAGQRGASQNVGMIARQAGQTGANLQQQAIGQNATMQANQSLNAIGAQGNMANNMASGAQNAVQGYTNSVQGEQSNVLNALGNLNAANASMQNGVNAANASLANTKMGQQSSLMSNLTSAGGMTSMLAEGGEVGQPSAPSGPRSSMGRKLHGIQATPQYAHGGKIDAMVSPGEGYLDKKAVKEVAKGKDPIKASEKIPGEPKVKGAVNSYANDTVPKKLEKGGIVLPRSVMESNNPHWEAHKFVSAIMSKQGKIPKKSK